MFSHWTLHELMNHPAIYCILRFGIFMGCLSTLFDNFQPYLFVLLCLWYYILYNLFCFLALLRSLGFHYLAHSSTCSLLTKLVSFIGTNSLIIFFSAIMTSLFMPLMNCFFSLSSFSLFAFFGLCSQSTHVHINCLII